jgi:ketosteroid isomerase-like protein
MTQSQTPAARRQSATEEELRSLVRQWDEAYVKGDAGTLDKLLADEFAFVGGPTKAQYLASFKSTEFVIESAVSTDLQVQVYDDAAVVTGVDTITGKNKGQTFQTKWLYMDVWVKRGKRWQCVKTYSMPVK